MSRLKKILYFVAGFFVVPMVLGTVMSAFLQRDYVTAVEFFGGCYLIVYIGFALLYRRKIKNVIPNRYVFYLLLYLPFVIMYFFSTI